MARRYRRSDEPLDDLVQVATLGLIKAIDRFDPARQTAFSSFAVPTILGELKRHFRDKGWSVRVPRDLQELAVKVDRKSTRLNSSHANSSYAVFCLKKKNKRCLLTVYYCSLEVCFTNLFFAQLLCTFI